MKRNSTKVWKHPIYSFARCYERYGKVYTLIHYKGQRYRSGTTYKWNNESKQKAIDLLTTSVESIINKQKEIVEVNPDNEINTVFKLITLFGSLHVQKLSPTAQRKFKDACRHFLSNDFFLKDIDGIFFHVFEKAKKSKLHVNTQHKLLSNLRQMFAFGIDRGYIQRNPINKELLPKIQNEDIQVFTDYELKKVIDHLKSEGKEELILLIRFIMLTGVRIKEAMLINWNDIKKDSILINGKGKRKRHFPRLLFPELDEILNKLSPNKERNKGKLFSWHSYTKIELWVRDACKKQDIYSDGKNFHSIRKYCENKLINDDDFNPYEVAEIMGHSIRVQEAHYKETLGAKRLTDKIMLRRKNRNA